MARKFVIGIDVDDTLMPYTGILLDLYQRKYGEEIKMERVTEWGFTNFLQETRDRLYGIMAGNEVQERQYPWSDALWLLRELMQRGHSIVFASAVSPEHMDIRADQIRRFFLSIGNADIMLGSRKDLLECDFLLDDCADNIQKSHAKHGCLIRRPWNAHAKGNFHVVSDHKEFLALVDEYAGKPEKKIACLLGPEGCGKGKIAEALSRDGRYQRASSTNLLCAGSSLPTSVITTESMSDAISIKNRYGELAQVFYVFRPQSDTPEHTQACLSVADAVISYIETEEDAANAIRHFMR